MRCRVNYGGGVALVRQVRKIFSIWFAGKVGPIVRSLAICVPTRVTSSCTSFHASTLWQAEQKGGIRCERMTILDQAASLPRHKCGTGLQSFWLFRPATVRIVRKRDDY